MYHQISPHPTAALRMSTWSKPLEDRPHRHMHVYIVVATRNDTDIRGLGHHVIIEAFLLLL